MNKALSDMDREGPSDYSKGKSQIARHVKTIMKEPAKDEKDRLQARTERPSRSIYMIIRSFAHYPTLSSTSIGNDREPAKRVSQ